MAFSAALDAPGDGLRRAQEGHFVEPSLADRAEAARRATCQSGRVDVECPDGQVASGTCKTEEHTCAGESKDVGYCECVPAPTYASWAADWGIAGDAPTADADHDGIPHALEFVIGGDPVAAFSGALMPTETLDAMYLNVAFRRTDISAAYAPHIQFSTVLATWTSAVHDVDGVVILEEDDYFGPGVDRVTVRLPRVGVPGMFTRLRVTIT